VHGACSSRCPRRRWSALFVRVRTAGRIMTDAALIHCQESRARCAPPTSATSTRRYWGTRHTFSTGPRPATQKRKWTMAQERTMATVDRTVSTLRRQLRHHRTAAVPSCSSSSNLGRRRSSVSPSPRPHTPWAVAWMVVLVPVPVTQCRSQRRLQDRDNGSGNGSDSDSDDYHYHHLRRHRR
jgi:hypothetical protein